MTPSTKRKASATDRLRELEAAVVAAEAAEAAARSKRTSSARWLPRAQAELAAFLIAVENGERDHDAAVERELRDRVQDLEALRGAEDTPAGSPTVERSNATRTRC